MLSNLYVSNYSALQYNHDIVDDLIKICDPLNQCFGINFFGYTHFFNNGTYIDFCTNTNWESHYLQHFGSKSFIHKFIKRIFDKNVQYVLWDNNIDRLGKDELSEFIASSCSFDVWHGFTIYKKKQLSIEAWHFATTRDNYKLINFYINNLDVFEHFILYFQDKASDFIKVDDRDKLVVLKNKEPLLTNTQSRGTIDKIAQFNQQTNIQKFCFETKHGVIFLSKRETECMKHLLSSKTMKEVAKLMDISPRTVEHYITNIKQKVGCWTKSQLIEAFSESALKFY